MAGKITKTEYERFTKFFIVADSGCWIWQSSLGGSNKGYGKFGVTREGQKQLYAHRWSYEHFKGPIPEGMVIDHLCRNTLCVNPDHLEPVTQRTNIMRGDADQAKRSKQTHCIHGHPFDETNTYITSDGFRKCKACGLERDRIRRPNRGLKPGPKPKTTPINGNPSR